MTLWFPGSPLPVNAPVKAPGFFAPNGIGGDKMSDRVNNSQRQQSTTLEDRLHDLRDVASDVRLQSYRQSDRDDIETVVVYLWNLRISEALYPILAIFEVTLRNAMHNALSERFGSESWFDQKDVLLERERSSVAHARETLQRDDKPAYPDHIVARMNLGFWVALLQRPYEETLWRADGAALMKAVFPYCPKKRRSRNQLWEGCNRARVLRNRVAHYRPVFNQDQLEEDHAATVEIIGWMSRAMDDLVTLTDRFDDVWTNGENQARGRLGELWKAPSSVSD